MKSLFLFSARESFLHRLDPRPKALLVLAVLFLIFYHSSVLYIGAVFLALVLALRLLGSIGPSEYKDLLVMFTPLLLVVTVINSLTRLGGEPLLVLGPLAFGRAGAELGLLISTRLATMGMVFALFVMTTNPTDIALALSNLGIPYRLAYLTSFALRFLPLFQDELMTLLTAVAARGHPWAGSQNPIRQALGVAIVSPALAVGFARRATDVALAMDLRGYRARRPRTFLKRLRYRPADWLATGAVTAFAAASWWLRNHPLDLLGTLGLG